MELDIHKISIAHKKGGDKIFKIFDNVDECLKYCEIANAYGGDLASDPLYAFLEQCKARANIRGAVN